MFGSLRRERGNQVQSAVRWNRQRQAPAEALEQRHLMAIDPVLVNFQLAGAEVPSGYLADEGLLYGDRGNGQSYGWSSDHTDVSRDRNVNADQRLDTLIHFHAGQTWELALPNGEYSVLVSVGDGANPSTHTLNVEGVNVVNAEFLGPDQYISRTVSVTVADGRLTLDQGEAVEKATRINYLEVRSSGGTGDNQNPTSPTITEPLFDGKVVNPEDVHMEAPNFSDPDGDGHFSSDWEIRVASTDELVWAANGLSGVEKVHTHLGDGRFQGNRTGERSLAESTDYLLRVRHRDTRGGVSAWSVRRFTTGQFSQVFALELDDVANSPTPRYRNSAGSVMTLPSGGEPGRLFLESATGQSLLTVTGAGLGNITTNPDPLSAHVPVRVRFTAGSQPIVQGESSLFLVDETGVEHTLYFPTLNVPAGQSAYFWIDGAGASYFGTAEQTVPDFSRLAQSSIVPYRATQPGYRVEEFAGGLQLPVNISMIPSAGTGPNDPYMYVTELYGTIKMITRNGTVSDYATNLLNFNPTGDFPGSGEQGLSGIAVDPATGDVYAAMLYSSVPGVEAAPHYPRVVRFTSTDGGRTAATQTTILDMVGESQGQSHQISSVSIGPDGKLYVHMGDGFDAGTAQNLNSYRGKILRLNLDGSPPTDNPFYDGGTRNARDYVFAQGVRNPFGGSFQQSSGKHYTVENGPSVDRFARIDRGVNYGWDGSDQSMFVNALYNWVPAEAPVNIAFVEPGVFGGSNFPPSVQHDAFVTLSGGTFGQGPGVKKIARFDMDEFGNYLGGGPQTFVTYVGGGRGTFAGLAAGPDGLYFTELYKDQTSNPIERGARILRVVSTGAVDFGEDIREGTTNLAVKFTDRSSVSGIQSWSWNFGDGNTSTEQNPTHVYTTPGNYSVTLVVTSASGVSQWQKNNLIRVLDPGTTGPGIKAEYFAGREFDAPLLTRVDPRIAFDWGAGSPDPAIPVDGFAARWTTSLQVVTGGNYTFYTTTDDGVRLYIDGQPVIEKWVDQAPTEHSGTVSLTAGVHQLRMEYYENGGGALAQLRWEGPGITKRFIPSSAFSQPIPFNQPPRVLTSGERLLAVDHAVTFTFHEDVGASLSADDITLVGDNGRRFGNGGEPIVLNYNAGTRTATVTFPGLPYGRLPFGNYTVTVASAGVADAAGAALDGNADNVAGDDFIRTLNVLANEDPDGNGTYDIADFILLRRDFGRSATSPFFPADLDQDGKVDISDFITLRRLFGLRFRN